ncbi:MAG TPA: UDP-N-acetylmuramate--L-alanine ligase [Thermoleophilia bacterium]|nr:UDP-N-acetylmuramate--L-alanine ligase [Thermoleophilia bacterium]
MNDAARDFPQPVHFVGIGGAGMSGIAAVLHELGVDVRGSDLKASRYTRHLIEAGVPVIVGHDAANLGDAAVVVTSSAINAANPEVRAARAAGLPILRRAEMLARVMELRRGIAVAGTHGKTTTSSMISHVLRQAGMDPTFLVGGELNDIGSNAGVGRGEWLVAEADESDGSLLYLRPEVAVVSNVELDHHANYGCLDDVQDVFRRFVALLPSDGLLVLVEGSGGEALASETPAAVVTVGIGAGDLRAEVERVDDRGSEFTVLDGGGEELARIELRVPGEHNVLNALTALAVLRHAGVGPADAAPHLLTFSGAARRFQRVGEYRGVLVVDDYAHHPTEITATLTAALKGDHRRVIAVFQPHLYSRTRYLQREFGRALTLADEAIVTEIFPAREEPEPGVSGKLIVDAYLAERPGGPVSFLPRLHDVVARLAPRVRPGDLVLTLGAGDVFRAGEQLLATLAGQGEERPAPNHQG